MTKEWIKDVPNWEKEYLKMGASLSLRQKEILNGADLKSNEGMMYGLMYNDWKIKKQLND